MTEGTPEDRTEPVGSAATAPQKSALVVELWYDAPVDLSDAALMAELRTISPRAEQPSGSLAIPHGNGVDGTPPLLTAVVAATSLIDGKALPDVSQTWDWAGADEAVTRCRFALIVSEMFFEWSDREERVSALNAVLRILLAQTRPVLIHWPHSQRVVDPAAVADDLGGAINIRLFGVDGDQEAFVMDSLGLHLFGLPDVQCHFRGREPAEIAALLHSTASYLFDSGDVIDDGNTISDWPDSDRSQDSGGSQNPVSPQDSDGSPDSDGTGVYTCFHESALIAPHRQVLDIDLGDPHAAGQRDRGTA